MENLLAALLHSRPTATPAKVLTCARVVPTFDPTPSTHTMLRIYFANKNDRSQIELAVGPLEFGREPRRGQERVVLADGFVSGDQMRIEEQADGQLRVENLSRRVPIKNANGRVVAPGESTTFDLPARLTLGETLVDIERFHEDPAGAGELATIDPPVDARPADESSPRFEGLDDLAGANRIARWFEAVVAIQRAAASRSEFYLETAKAILDLVGLDCGMILLRQQGDWRVVARATASSGGEEVSFSRTILDRMRQDRRTFFQSSMLLERGASLVGVNAVVASPIFGADNVEVIGAVYGVRVQRSASSGIEIRPLEAQLVQVLAAAVGAGTARLGAEANASRRLVQFEQFFSPELARQLEIDPGLLKGREREITVLFSDIREFSALSELLSPREVCDLIADFMDRQTRCIRDHGGVVVDYIGDGLIAMWNAPTDQPDHARLACQAAQAIQAEIPALNSTWGERIGRNLALGIGLNTGPALVGNTGSKARFKYGPLGHAVNLASRVEGATKPLGMPILLTEFTRAHLGLDVETRRLCQVRVVGIAQAVSLYELPNGPVDDDWRRRRDTYEAALDHFEHGRMSEACRGFYPILSESHEVYDVPTLILASRALEALRSPKRPFDPVLELSSK